MNAYEILSNFSPADWIKKMRGGKVPQKTSSATTISKTPIQIDIHTVPKLATYKILKFAMTNAKAKQDVIQLLKGKSLTQEDFDKILLILDVMMSNEKKIFNNRYVINAMTEWLRSVDESMKRGRQRKIQYLIKKLPPIPEQPIVAPKQPVDEYKQLEQSLLKVVQSPSQAQKAVQLLKKYELSKAQALIRRFKKENPILYQNRNIIDGVITRWTQSLESPQLVIKQKQQFWKPSPPSFPSPRKRPPQPIGPPPGWTL